MIVAWAIMVESYNRSMIYNWYLYNGDINIYGVKIFWFFDIYQ